MSRNNTIVFLNALDTAQAQLDAHLQPLFKKWMELQLKIEQAYEHEASLPYEYSDHSGDGIRFHHEGPYDWNSYTQIIPWEFFDNPMLYTAAAMLENEKRLQRAKQQKINVARQNIDRITHDLETAKARLTELDTEEKAD